jgi:hypothetical protein
MHRRGLTIALPLESVAQGIALDVTAGLLTVGALLVLSYKRPKPKSARHRGIFFNVTKGRVFLP